MGESFHRHEFNHRLCSNTDFPNPAPGLLDYFQHPPDHQAGLLRWHSRSCCLSCLSCASMFNKWKTGSARHGPCSRQARPLPYRADHPRVKQSEIDQSLCDLGIPLRFTSTPSWPFVVLRGPSWITLFLLSFFLFQASPAPALPCRSSESETIRNRPIPLRPWYPVTVHLNALVALRRSSWPFVDSSFSFVFFRLFQTSEAPALPCRSSESETIRNRPIPSRPWYPVTVHLNALVALRGPSCVFVDHSFSFVFFRLFQASEAPAPHDGADHPSGKQIVFQEKCLQVSWFQLVPRSEAAWAPGLFQASEAPAPHDGADHPSGKQIVFQEKCLQVSWFQLVPRSEAAWAPGLFQASVAPALSGRSSESETIRNRLSLRDLGIPSRLTPTP